ncbi:hypothetical protein [Brachybacterium kimchii]|uniref:Uncharacterized protein n=1 Tax=Brachybacterium kimchii TaxID=2942909 RepID=A0ABY4N2Q7_9MICO|nr:hypothetical protein [Brachybacterium kimchii]UQN28419.1 hypothetical protein M4486_12290 [Brachybacterium kimchii]
MNTTRASHPSTTPTAPTSAPASASDRGLLMDVLGVTPAPTLARELFALVVNAALVAILLFVLQPPMIAAVIAGSLVGAWLVGRLIAGFVRHGYGRPEAGRR